MKNDIIIDEEWQIYLSCSSKEYWLFHNCVKDLQGRFGSMAYRCKEDTKCSLCGKEIPKHILFQMRLMNGK